MNEISPVSGKDKHSVIVRASKLSTALSSAARQLTFQNRSRRNLYHLAGLTPRIRDRIFSILLILNFILLFFIPFFGSVLYFVFIVTPKYESSTKFVLRSATPVLSRDRFADGGATPSPKIIQDTQIVVNYLTSQDFLKKLKEVVNIKNIYGDSKIDYLSRLDIKSSKEEQLDYWEDQFDAWISPKSGIVEIQMRAFTANDAQSLLQHTVRLSETRVNQLNQGIWSTLIAAAETDFKQASDELERRRLEFRDIQNSTGVFDLEQTAGGVNEIITGLNSEIANLNSQEDVMSQSLSSTSPQMTDLRRRINARRKQVEALNAEFTSKSDKKNKAFSGYSTLFEQSRLEQELAEERFATSVRELERVKLISSLQLVYLDKFVEPTLPETNKYPRVFLMISLSFGACLLAWGAFTMVILLFRTKLD